MALNPHLTAGITQGIADTDQSIFKARLQSRAAGGKAVLLAKADDHAIAVALYLGQTLFDLLAKLCANGFIFACGFGG